MKQLIYMTLVLLSACGKVYQVDADFQPYVAEFERLGVKKVDNLIIEYGETSNASAGATCYLGSGTPRIAVDKEGWSQIHDSQRRQTLFHEMGHCVLNREHTTDRFEDNCPKSYMNASPVSWLCLQHHSESDYESELFQ